MRNSILMGVSRLLCSCALIAYTGAGLAAEVPQDEVPEITWEELMPKDWNPMAALLRLEDEGLGDLSDDSAEAEAIYEEVEASLRAAPVVAELDGEIVRLPGYVLPLEFEETSVREFLLVPYFGACIHVPPPPSNQIVFVKSDEPIDITGMFDAVWVTGEIKTVPVSSEVADAGYTMNAIKVDPYEY